MSPAKKFTLPAATKNPSSVSPPSIATSVELKSLATPTKHSLARPRNRYTLATLRLWPKTTTPARNAPFPAKSPALIASRRLPHLSAPKGLTSITPLSHFGPLLALLSPDSKIPGIPSGRWAMKKSSALVIAAFLFAASAPLVTRGQSQSQAPAPPYDSQQPPDQGPPDLDPATQPPDPQLTPQQQQQAEQQQADTQPLVARVSIIQGDASTQRGDNGEWSAATVNTPISVGDTLSTGDNSRAELQLDALDVLRLSNDSSAKLSALARNQIQIQVSQGLVTFSALHGSSSAVEIDTPNVAVRPRGDGQFRILVSSNSQTIVTVRRGSADIATPQGSTSVSEGQSITVDGTDNPQYQVSNSPSRDDWDSWNNDRDNVILNAQSWQHTNRNYTGTEDLDGYGNWQNVPDYGQVWVPSVAPGWAPYRAGRWVYEPYYGWTWVSYEPWGWAPYHYGRWFVYGGNWAWWPGPVVAYPGYYPVWAPAYVSFWGWGGGGFGFGIGFGWGHVGWLPIGPCDWYRPWYGRWGGGGRVYNYTSIHNTTIINRGFSPLTRGGAHPYSNFAGLNNNARLREGFTSMDGNRFGREAVPGRQTGIDQATLRQANFVSGRMPIQPSRGSYSASGRGAGASTIHNVPSHMFSSSMAPQRSLPSNYASRSSFGSSNQPRGESRSQPYAANSRGNWQSFNNQDRGGQAPSGTQRGNSGYRQPGPNSGESRMMGAPSARSNWHAFTPPSGANSGQGRQGYSASNQNNRGFQAPGNYGNRQPESRFNSPSGPSENVRGYQAPPSNYGRQGEPRSYAPQSQGRSYQPPPAAYRGGSNYSSRPPLNLHQNVVQPRGGNRGYSAPSYRGGGGGGGYHGGGGGGGSHGGGGGHGGGHR